MQPSAPLSPCPRGCGALVAPDLIEFDSLAERQRDESAEALRKIIQASSEAHHSDSDRAVALDVCDGIARSALAKLDEGEEGR